MVSFLAAYHADSERADVVHVFEAVLPRDEALDVDVQLIPNAHDGFIILLVSRGNTSVNMQTPHDQEDLICIITLHTFHFDKMINCSCLVKAFDTVTQ